MIKFRDLKPEEVECRVSQCTANGCSLLLYKTARCDMNLLDETVGPENWQNRYVSVDGKIYCELAIRCDGEWIWKSDTGTESNMEAQKGEASDAFKRAGFRWGIGRELYTAPRIWVGSDKCKVEQAGKDRYKCYDRFAVTDMKVDGGRIVALQIANMSRKGAIVYGSTPNVPKQTNPNLKDAKNALWTACKTYAEWAGMQPKEIADGVAMRPEWEEQKESAEYLMAVARELTDAARA